MASKRSVQAKAKRRLEQDGASAAGDSNRRVLRDQGTQFQQPPPQRLKHNPSRSQQTWQGGEAATAAAATTQKKDAEAVPCLLPEPMVIREHQLRVLGAEMQLEARAKYAGIASEEELQQLYNLFGLLKNTHPGVVCRLSFWDDLESLFKLLPNERLGQEAGPDPETVTAAAAAFRKLLVNLQQAYEAAHPSAAAHGPAAPSAAGTGADVAAGSTAPAASSGGAAAVTGAGDSQPPAADMAARGAQACSSTVRQDIHAAAAAAAALAEAAWIKHTAAVDAADGPAASAGVPGQLSAISAAAVADGAAARAASAGGLESAGPRPGSSKRSRVADSKTSTGAAAAGVGDGSAAPPAKRARLATPAAPGASFAGGEEPAAATAAAAGSGVEVGCVGEGCAAAEADMESKQQQQQQQQRSASSCGADECCGREGCAGCDSAVDALGASAAMAQDEAAGAYGPGVSAADSQHDAQLQLGQGCSQGPGSTIPLADWEEDGGASAMADISSRQRAEDAATAKPRADSEDEEQLQATEDFELLIKPDISADLLQHPPAALDAAAQGWHAGGSSSQPYAVGSSSRRVPVAGLLAEVQKELQKLISAPAGEAATERDSSAQPSDSSRGVSGSGAASAGGLTTVHDDLEAAGVQDVYNMRECAAVAVDIAMCGSLGSDSDSEGEGKQEQGVWLGFARVDALAEAACSSPTGHQGDRGPDAEADTQRAEGACMAAAPEAEPGTGSPGGKLLLPDNLVLPGLPQLLDGPPAASGGVIKGSAGGSSGNPFAAVAPPNPAEVQASATPQQFGDAAPAESQLALQQVLKWQQELDTLKSCIDITDPKQLELADIILKPLPGVPATAKLLKLKVPAGLLDAGFVAALPLSKLPAAAAAQQHGNAATAAAAAAASSTAAAEKVLPDWLAQEASVWRVN